MYDTRRGFAVLYKNPAFPRTLRAAEVQRPVAAPSPLEKESALDVMAVRHRRVVPLPALPVGVVRCFLHGVMMMMSEAPI
jgi:hypothetical protein